MKIRSAAALLFAAACLAGCAGRETSAPAETAAPAQTEAPASSSAESAVPAQTEAPAASSSAETSAAPTAEEKAAALQEVFYQTVYSDSRDDFSSDAIFANFRELRGGNLKPGAFYRSASPCYDIHHRAAYADQLAKEAGVQSVLNLSDTEQAYEIFRCSDGFSSMYYDGLVQSGNVQFLALDTVYFTDRFIPVISAALLEMTQHETPCLIHCVEGMHRTGFVSMLLLCLADASADEMLGDFMTTFANYYGIAEEAKPLQYAAVRDYAADLLRTLCGAAPGTDPDSLDLKAGAEAYLRQGGLTDEQIAQIERFLVNS